MSKIILVDTSTLFVPTVKVWGRLNEKNIVENREDFILPSSCMYLNSLFSTLAKIHVEKGDKVLILDEGHSWRKDWVSSYKAQRQELREKDYFVDWTEKFKEFNEIHEQLDKATDWYFVKEPKYCEVDDLVSIACRYFKNDEVIIVTSDTDLFQLAYYQNVSIFSLNKKFKGSKGFYDTIKNPLKIINDKVRLGDKSDNIIPQDNDTDEDQELRHFIINLLELPLYVEEKGLNAIKQSLKKQGKNNTDLLPKFEEVDYIIDRFNKIYDGSKKITKEQCLEFLKKQDEEKKLKQKEKRRFKNDTKV